MFLCDLAFWCFVLLVLVGLGFYFGFGEFCLLKKNLGHVGLLSFLFFWVFFLRFCLTS